MYLMIFICKLVYPILYLCGLVYPVIFVCRLVYPALLVLCELMCTMRCYGMLLFMCMLL